MSAAPYAPANTALNPAPGYDDKGSYTPQEDTVASRLNGLLQKDSPLMQTARTQATEVANQRGLQNSSIAAGAGEDAVIRSALPIASQDASATTQKNLSAQGAAQAGTLQAQSIAGQQQTQAQAIQGQKELQSTQIDANAQLQYNQITATKEMTQAQLQSTEYIAQQNIAAAERNLGRQLNAQETMQIRQIAATQTLQDTQVAAQKEMQGTGIAAQKEMQGSQIAATASLSEAGIAAQKEMTAAQQQTQKDIAGMNISAADRQAATNANVQMAAIYTNMFDSITNNPNIPADQRDAYLTNAKTLAANNAALIKSIYGSTIPAQP